MDRWIGLWLPWVAPDRVLCVPSVMASRLKIYLRNTLRELVGIPIDPLLEARYQKFRRMGAFLEGPAIEEGPGDAEKPVTPPTSGGTVIIQRGLKLKVLGMLVDKKESSRRFDIDKPVVTIGRAPGNNFVVEHATVSRRHACIEPLALAVSVAPAFAQVVTPAATVAPLAHGGGFGGRGVCGQVGLDAAAKTLKLTTEELTAQLSGVVTQMGGKISKTDSSKHISSTSHRKTRA